MNYLKKNILLFFTLIFLSKFAFSQYLGGVASGFNLNSLNQTSCNIPENWNIFFGGNSDGISNQNIIQNLCLPTENWNIFFGGETDGFSNQNLIQNLCLPTENWNIFFGGEADGFSNQNLIQNLCLPTENWNIFFGGDADGFSNQNLIQNLCLPTENWNIFFGGDSDGFSNQNLIQNLCLPVENWNIFFGGNADGFSNRNLIQNLCPPVENLNIFFGGISDGFSTKNNILTWQGDDIASPTDWNTASNWDKNLIPDFTNKVVIPKLSSSIYPEINISANSKCLLIYPNTSLDIYPVGSLSVAKDLQNYGILNINSPNNSNPSGSLIVNGSILGTGTANIQRYYSVNNRWQYTTVPFSNVNSDFFTRNAAPDFNANFYKYNETFDIIPDPTGAIYSNWSQLSAAWQLAHNGEFGIAENLLKSKGYIYFDASDRLLTYSNIVTDISNSDLIFALTLNSNDANSGYFDGWNLIGNPYPSAIDWDTFAKTNIQNTVYYWDGNNQQYVYYNGFGGTETGDGSNYVNGGSRYIPSLQAFFVKATATGNFTIPRTARVHSNQTMWKTDETTTNSEIPYIKLTAKSENLSDEICIRFMENATDNFDDDFDAYKMFSNANPNLFSLSDDIPIALNSLPEFDENMIIPIGFTSLQTGNYQIVLTINNLSDFINVYLKDLTNTVVTNLNNSAYSFSYPNANSTKLFSLYFTENQTNITDLEKSEIDIYSSGKTIFVLIPDLKSPADFYLYNSIGQLILQDKLTNHNSEIFSDFASGIYIIKIRNKETLLIKKVIIN